MSGAGQGLLGFALEPGKVFSPTAPIDELELFAGRTDQVRAVVDAINQKGQHTILFGERGVGKTSLANVLSAFLSGQGVEVLAPRINCAAMDTFDAVWKKALDEIWMHQEIKKAGFGADVEDTKYSSAELLSGDIGPDAVRRALTIISQNSLPILILDEFDRLDNNVKRGIADTIKTLSDHAVAATVVLVGVADSVDELIEEHQSVERALVQVRMPRMSPDEVKEIIHKGLARLSLNIEKEALDRIALLSQGLPHYAHLLGLYSSRQAMDGKSGTVRLPDVDEAIKSSLNNSQQSIQRGWHDATTSPRKHNLFSDVLLACAFAETDELGFFAAQDVRQPLCEILERKLEIANFAQHLIDFCDSKRGPILERRGQKRRYRFRFLNPLMQPFVIMQGFASGKVNQSLIARTSVAG